MRALLEAVEKFELQLTESNQVRFAWLLQRSMFFLTFSRAQESAKRILTAEDDLAGTNWTDRGLGEQLTQDVQQLWADTAIQQAFVRSSEFQLPDSAE